MYLMLKKDRYSGHLEDSFQNGGVLFLVSLQQGSHLPSLGASRISHSIGTYKIVSKHGGGLVVWVLTAGIPSTYPRGLKN